MLSFEVDPGGVAGKRLREAAASTRDGRTLFRQLAGALEAQTEANFAAQGRPSWVPLSRATIAARRKRNKGGSLMRILQDAGILASSVSSTYGPDFAQVGAGGAARDYAAIHQFGGVIDRPAYSIKTRLRTDAKGGLVRQAKDGKGKNLAVFAKDSHKRVREGWSTVEAYKVAIPARPYLPFSGPPESAALQPEAEQTVLDLIERHIRQSLAV